MEISEDNMDHRSEAHGTEFKDFSHQDKTISVVTHSCTVNPLSGSRTPQAIEQAISSSAVSFDSCDADELMHCYQIAIDFGVPTAHRALEHYKSRSRNDEN